jgi:hypothetical protein
MSVVSRSLAVIFGAVLCIAQAALAVQPGQSSGTAEIVCAYRAIAAQHPDPKLRNPDDLAAKLCSRPSQWPADYDGANQMIRGEGALKGTCHSYTTRQRISMLSRKGASGGVSG